MKMRSIGNIRQRSLGSYEIRYTLGTDAATGKRRTVTTTVTGNRRAAEKELRRLLRTLDAGEHVDPSRMTVREWLTMWLATVREEVSPKSHERYAEIVENFLTPAVGNLPLVKLTPSHIQEAYNAWATGGRPTENQVAFLHVHAATSIGYCGRHLRVRLNSNCSHAIPPTCWRGIFQKLNAARW